MKQQHTRLRLPLIVCILAISSGLPEKESKLGDPGIAAAPAADSMFGKEAGQVRDDNSLKMKLVWCPPGAFVMGDFRDDDVQRDKDGNRKPDVTEPVRALLTCGFWLGSHEVTQAEWSYVMDSAPWRGKPKVKEGRDFPASYISFDDAAAFCRSLTDNERQARRLPDGWEYSLPTEAQWERACRAGSENAILFRRGRVAARRICLELFQRHREERSLWPSRRPEESQRLGPVRYARQHLGMVPRPLRGHTYGR
jgi:formylglycine-generating enzyme required for sulfatase activity